jgi:4-hydroxybenzoate polyprenyltransferase
VRTAAGVFRLVHPFPSLLVAAVTTALVPLANHSAGPALYVEVGLGMLLYQFAIGAANDVLDEELDRRTKPWKPIVAGRVSRRLAIAVAAACAAGGMVATLGLDPGPWAIGLGALALGLAYDGGIKRTSLSWLPVALAFPLVPAFAFTAAGAWDPYLWWAFPIGLLFGFAVHMANQVPDIRSDSAVGVRGAAHRLGARRASGLALGAFGLGVSLATAVLLARSSGRAALAALAGLLVLLLAPRASRLFGRDGLFGVISVSCAAVAVVFLSAV